MNCRLNISPCMCKLPVPREQIYIKPIFQALLCQKANGQLEKTTAKCMVCRPQRTRTSVSSVWLDKGQEEDANALPLTTLWRSEIARGHGAAQRFTRTT